MREIKFRSWDERKEIMHYDFEFIRSGIKGNDWIVFKSDFHPLDSKPHPFENPHFEQQFKIMQYTGLKDKNGTEIYEGDIVVDDAGNLGEIIWGSYGWLINFEAETLDPDETEVWAKIIGNIYQHPELLNQ